jgi:uncharacterized membrane protein
MNKLLLAVFETEADANVGLQALHTLHRSGEITLYATGIVARDAQGGLSVRKGLDIGAAGGMAAGLALGSLIGLLGGPLGLATGAVAGSAAGALRDFWVAGVGLDFIDDAERQLQPGKVALLAEIEEEWIVPVDVALEAAGGVVMRRGRSDLAEAGFHHDIETIEAEIAELQAEASAVGGAAQAHVKARLMAAQAALDAAVQRRLERVSVLRDEADAKTRALQAQWAETQGDVKARVDQRLQRVQKAYHARGAKLAHAWGLAREALSA